MKLEEFEALIQKEYIEDVLKRFSPRVTYRREYHGHHFPGYEIGLDTNPCRFLFVCEEQSDVMVAPFTSKFENIRDNWFSLERLICFLANKPFEWETPYQNMSHDDRLIHNLYAIKKKAIPYISQLTAMFSNLEGVAEWISRYEHYEDEQFKLKYPNFYNEYIKRKSGKIE